MLARQAYRRVKYRLFSRQRQPMKIRCGLFRGVAIRAVPADSLQLMFGLSERETYKYVRQALRRADWFIDIGAGLGEMTILFDRAGKANPLVAVEPWTMDLLKDNLALNGARRAVLDGRYMGTEPAQLPLDDVAVPRDRKGFIKLDADTAELAILESGRHLLAQARPMLLVETHSPALERDCRALLTGLGYRTEIIRNAWWRAIVPEQRPMAHNRWLWAE